MGARNDYPLRRVHEKDDPARPGRVFRRLARPAVILIVNTVLKVELSLQIKKSFIR